MVLRTFFAIDSDNLVVTASSDPSLIGSGVGNQSQTPDGTVFSFSSGGGTSITLDDDDFFADSIPEDNNLFINDDDPFDHTIVDGGGIVSNGTGVEAESIILVRALNSAGDPTGPVIELTVFSQNGDPSDIWGFGSDRPLVDGTSYVKVGGDLDGTTRYSDFVTCFAAATMIETDTGAKRVEDIVIGDRVLTRDNGYQPVRWIGKRRLSGADLAANTKLRPIRILQNSLGNGLPRNDLVVSRQHRMLVQSRIAERMFGAVEVLVPAIKLTVLPGIFIDDSIETVAYFHLLFDRHEVIYAEGTPSESFYLGREALASVGTEAREEILTIFPEIAKLDFAAKPARHIPAARLQKRLLARHLCNNKPIVHCDAER